VKSSAVAATLLGIALATPALAGDQVPKETVDRIEKALAEVGCKPTEIERDDKGYNLDDAECADGLNDIKLDKDFKITSRRKE
jgi:hypothetical protein